MGETRKRDCLKKIGRRAEGRGKRSEAPSLGSRPSSGLFGSFSMIFLSSMKEGQSSLELLLRR